MKKIRILYLTGTPQYSHVVKSLESLNCEVVYSSKINPRTLPGHSVYFLQKMIAIMTNNRITDVKVKSRFWIWPNLVSLICKVLNLVKSLNFAEKFAETCRTYMLQSIVSKSKKFDLLIITTDYLDLDFDKVGIPIILEAREPFGNNVEKYNLEFMTKKLSRVLFVLSYSKFSIDTYMIQHFTGVEFDYAPLPYFAHTFDYEPGRKRDLSIVYVARQNKLKLLKEIADFAIKYELKLHVVGKVNQLTKTSNNNIKYYGQLRRRDLFKLLNKSRFVVCLNEESFGYVALEALELGCSLIALPECGVTEWLDVRQYFRMEFYTENELLSIVNRAESKVQINFEEFNHFAYSRWRIIFQRILTKCDI